jgi:hypothetical protein
MTVNQRAMKVNMVRNFSCLILLLLILAGCTKHVPGSQGDQGAAGNKGNLKLHTITKQVGSWTSKTKGWESFVSVNEISSKVINSGEIEVFMLREGKWLKLPYAMKGNLFMHVTFERDLLHIKYDVIHDETPAKPGNITLRLVFLEPVS